MLLTVFKLIGSNLIKNNVHGSLLKTIGFGFAATSVQDLGLEEEWNVYNVVAFTVGAAGWMGGLYLERRHAKNNYSAPVKTSTAIMKQALAHGGGFGLVASITHFVKDVDTPSGKFAVLNMALIAPAAILELNRAALIYPTIPWEKVRLLVLIVGDCFFAAGAKRIMNDGSKDALTILSTVLGFALSVGEGAYGLKKDRGLTLQSFINRRIFKIMAGVNFIFTLLDIINKDNDKYTIADNVYLTASSTLLFATLLELRAIALQARERNAAWDIRFQALRTPLQAEENNESATPQQIVEIQPVDVGEKDEIGVLEARRNGAQLSLSY